MNLGDYWAVLLTGLLAGGLSCAAVQGGLLAALVSRQHGKSSGLGDDLAPVAGFLTGKLVSHALLGLLLGALGGAVQFSTTTRGIAQVAAGVLILVFGLAQLGVPGFKRLTVTPPAAWTRFVRGRTRSQSALAPAILGFCTILIPCGVTISVMALAVTTQSPLAGALTMAIFVAGTAPLFAIIGYAARKANHAWQGRLANITGIVILGVGLFTLNGGLTALDSPLSATNLAQTLGIADPPATAATVSIDQDAQIAVLIATEGGYSPRNIQVAAGKPTTLKVRSKDAFGCERAFVIRGKQYVLPENGDTDIDLGVLEPGGLRFQCSMGMYTGKLTIVAAQP